MRGRHASHGLTTVIQAVEVRLLLEARRGGPPSWSAEHELALAVIRQAIRDIPTSIEAREFFESTGFVYYAVICGFAPEYIVRLLRGVGLLPAPFTAGVFNNTKHPISLTVETPTHGDHGTRIRNRRARRRVVFA